MTVPAYDILKKDGLRGPSWIEAVGDLEQAKDRARKLAAITPGEYIVFNHKTGKIVANVSATTASNPA
jgi:hypothetical protein